MFAEPATRGPKFLPPPKCVAGLMCFGLAEEWVSAWKELVVPRPGVVSVADVRPIKKIAA